MADDMPKVEFREFQEYEPQNDASRANLHTRRSDTEVGMVAAYHLAGRPGAGCWLRPFGLENATSTRQLDRRCAISIS